jgi:uncharacterized protein YbjT (DUF2867 family)
MRILVLGGYGFIGAAIVGALARAGHDVVGVGRRAGVGRRRLPEANWIGADIARLDSPQQWAPHLAGVDVIINAAGALQDGPRDDLRKVHHRSIVALADAASTGAVKRFIQISAVGADPAAATLFLRSKARGDAAVAASALDWVIFRPGLVIGQDAYGGTALLRLLAALPAVEWLAYPDAPLQTVSIDDVAEAVRRAAAGEIPPRAIYDLVEDAPHRLRDIVRAFRRWQGRAEPRLVVAVPPAAAAAIARLADVAGLFGWRSPLRTTAMRVIREGVIGDPAPWRRVAGRRLKSFEETLRDLPATAQERVFARVALVLPLIVATLGAFWIASGIVGLLALDRASAHLAGLGAPAANGLVVAGSLLDIAIGAGVLFRRTARAAAAVSVVAAAVYLIAGTLSAPQLWLDPFGALLKVFPVMALGAAAALMIEER